MDIDGLTSFVPTLWACSILIMIIPFGMPIGPAFAQEGAQNQIILNESSAWEDPSEVCSVFFSCARDNTTGWNDNASMRLSTPSNDIPMWSWIRGEEITNAAGKEYRVSSHMQLNAWATQSHFFVDGLNETSGEWYQLVQCPSGINGPLNWTEYNCQMTVPEDTNVIRPTLAAGWTSQPNEQAITWYDDIIIEGVDRNITGVSTQSNVGDIVSGLQLPP